VATSASIEPGGKSALRATVWVVGAVCLSVILGNICIFAGAVAALVLEGGVSRVASTALNSVAFGSMVVAYTLGLLLVCRLVLRRWAIPFAVWPALAVYPLIWAILVALPGDVYAATPAIVTGVGALVAWIVFGRAAGGAGSGTCNDSSPA